ncbi:uncharacterized protein LOC117537825 isoform X2 [Gymnodraco acuticeps]|uniref:Uncharacterized protein LOC117537825 isoform X2 n=1 Tax=Gymnodraco acuticeps TaxID=8218 RepID=A0A6P8T615_GYMAC|nr:uncharacterized protein LOC117537825 isoform X2 [Gymnodraco acuticeps]
MSEFRRIVMSSFLMLLLHFPAADLKRYIVRPGDEVTLPCDYVMHDQDKCERTLWRFYDSPYPPGVRLFEDGQIHKGAKAKSDRLRVTEKCSLVIKKVTEEDAGFYSCSQFNRSGEQQGPDSDVILSVVSMTEYQVNDEVTLRCSVETDGWCDPVKWLLQGRDVDKYQREIKTSQSPCSASVTFLTSHFSYTTRSELLSCEVTNGFTGEEHLFPFSPQSSDATTTGTPIDEWTSESNTGTGADCKHPEGPAVWWVILVSVGLAALIVTVVTVHIWTRAKGGKKRKRKNLEQNDEDEDEAEYENDGGASASV